MFEFSLPVWLIGIIGLTILLNLTACYVITRAPAYSLLQKAIQVMLIWFVPIVSAVVLLWFLWQDKRQAHTTGYAKSEDDKPRIPLGIHGD